jgi:hypothetical protein
VRQRSRGRERRRSQVERRGLERRRGANERRSRERRRGSEERRGRERRRGGEEQRGRDRSRGGEQRRGRERRQGQVERRGRERMWGGKKAPRPREETGRGRTAKTPTRGWMREGGGAKPRCGKEGAQSTARGRWLGAGGWRGQAPEATRMCGGSSHRRIAADEGQWANGGEGGSKTCGRHVDGSGAEAGKESTTRRQAGVGLSTHGGLDGQGLLGTLTSSIYAGGGRGRAVGRKALRGAVAEGG